MVSGALRPATQISIGTCEQLSTLYRLSLAEYLIKRGDCPGRCSPRRHAASRSSYSRAGRAIISFRTHSPRKGVQFTQIRMEDLYERWIWCGLTSLGGGAFGNDPSWIDAAIRRSLKLMSEVDLDVRLVSYRRPSEMMLQIVDDFH